MARTQQTARKSTGGQARRKQIAHVNSSAPLAHETASDPTEAEREDANLEETLLLAPSKAAVLEGLSVTSADRQYFEAILLLHRMKDQSTTNEGDVEAVLTAAKTLEAKYSRARATRLRHRLHLYLLERDDNRAYDYLAKELQLHCTAVAPENSERYDNDAESNTITFDVESIINEKVRSLVYCMTVSDPNELALDYQGVNVLSCLTPLTRENVFRALVRGSDDYGFSASQKRCVLQAFVSHRLLEWTDFPEYVDYLGSHLVSVDMTEIDATRVDSFRLSLAQLETLFARHESLARNTSFALQYAATLRSKYPATHQEREYLEAALASLERFQAPTTPLRFALLHHLLREVQYSTDAATVLRTYAAIARAAPYASPAHRHAATVHDVVFFDNASRALFPGAATAKHLALDEVTKRLGLAPISQAADESLLKSLLAMLLPREPDLLAALAPFLDAAFLETQYAIAMLYSGRGTRAEFEGRLSDTDVRRKVFESSDVRFAESNPETFAPGAPVALRLLVKNTPAITLQLFELNVSDSFRRTFAPIRSDVSLEGLLPNEERTVRFDGVPSHVRSEHVVEFASLSAAHRGVFVVEVVGANVSCRAVIRKGHVRFVATCSPRGHEFRVFDEAQARVTTFEVAVRDPHNAATVTTVASTREGVAVLPYFSARDDAVSVPSKYPVYVGVAGFGVLGTFAYCEEAYELRARFGIDSEQLVPGTRATVLLRAVLYLNGAVVPTSLLQGALWTIESTSQTGTVSRKELRNPPRFSDATDVMATIDIPTDAVTLQLTVAAAVVAPAGASVRSSRLRRVEHTQSFALHRSTTFDAALFAVHLQRAGDGFALIALGHNGEPVANASLAVKVRHQSLDEPIERTGVTNAQGQVLLGPLTDCMEVQATTKSGGHWVWSVPDATNHSWLERQLSRSAPPVHTVVGETAVLPLPPRTEAVLPDWLARGWITLMQHLDNKEPCAQVADPTRDAATVAVGDGASLTFVARVAGKYAVVLKPLGVEVVVCVASAVLAEGTGGVRLLAAGESLVAGLSAARPVTVAALATTPTAVTVTLRQATPTTRVHVILKRFVGRAGAGAFLGTSPLAAAATTTEAYPTSDYFASKRISDEYAYVLGRRAYAHANPASALLQGSLLPRPSLLLHPYAVDETESQRLADTKQGEAYSYPSRINPKCATARGFPMSRMAVCPMPKSPMPNTTFLANASVVVANLVPTSDGVVELLLAPLHLVGSYEVVVLAVDGETVASRQAGLKASGDATPLRDTRLAPAEALGRTPEAHFVQVRGHRCLAPGASIALPCVAAAKFEVYESLEHALSLMDALTGRTMRLHDFLTTWRGLDAGRKTQLYGEHASDELNVYLLKKDPAYFSAVVAPHLEAKIAKSFVDHYVLGHVVVLQAIFDSPVKLERLSIVEKLLLAERLPAPAANALLAYVVRVLEGYADESTHTKLPSLFEHILVAKNDADADADVTAPDDDPANMPASGPFGCPPPPMSASMPCSEGFSFGAPATATAFGGFGYASSAMTPFGTQGFGAPAALPLPASAFSDGGMETDFVAMSAPATADSDDYDMCNDSSDDEDEDETMDAAGTDEPTPTDAAARPSKPYKAPGATKKLHEKRYFDGTSKPQRARGGILPPSSAISRRLWAEGAMNHFWLDYARHLQAQSPAPFTSAYFPEAHSCFAEVLLAMAVLDLPLTSAATSVETTSTTVTVTAGAHPAIVYFEDLQRQTDVRVPDTVAAQAANLIVTQTLFLPSASDVGAGVLQPVAEAVVQTQYGCQVTVSNLSPRPVRGVQLLLQIPEGAVPLAADGFYTRSATFDLGGNETETVLFYFYFPAPGTFAHFGAHVALQDTTVRWAPTTTIAVAAARKRVDTTSWTDVVARGTTADVLRFLEAHAKLEALDWNALDWRLADRACYDAVSALLRTRLLHVPSVAQFAVQHRDREALRNVALRSPSFVTATGPGVAGIEVLGGEETLHAALELAEFSPLLPRRVHTMGGQKAPLNKELQAHYEALCAKLALLPALNSLHRLAITACLVALHRVDAAMAVFAAVDATAVPALQYDYMAAYLAFFGTDAAFPAARAAVTKYAAYPDARWRSRFDAVGAQLAALDALGQRAVAADSKADDVGIALTVHRDRVEITQKGRRVTHADVRFYPVDVEVLFSTEPFGATTAQASAVALVQPRVAVAVAVAPHATTTVAIPMELQALQMMVVLAPRGFPELDVTKPHFCDSMEVDVAVEDGRLQVFAAGRPLARAYVKVFAQTKAGAKGRFYKDGYTDVVGCFDYFGINDTKLLLQVKALAVLIVHAEHGAVVRQLPPPPAIVAATADEL
ncbi:hypothetical protein ACHHYP_05542 [Achlya hypogyna]|uniref:Uncharacterized protein n=1 Tax=Achlya hypogyna TaxID=1202772 RepID=A0A1V9ZNM9_ACHHY|nr:hypothetical protein ACHHYP_05542 [Achlya hypogyna]